MRVVLDSNIIVAAFAGRGLCNSLFELCQDRCTVILSNHILEEVERALLTEINIPAKNVSYIIDYLRKFSAIENYQTLKTQVCRDRDDDNILSLAKHSNSEYIITGDKDLLALGSYEKVKINTPRDFWEEIKNPNG